MRLRSMYLAAAMLLLALPARAASPDDLTPKELAAAKAARLDAAGLRTVIAEARASYTQRLVVRRHGKTVLDRRWGALDAPHPVMQLTFPVVALAIGRLVADGRIKTIDAPMTTWVPGMAAGITLRHVLTGRTGLSGEEISGVFHQQPDMIKFFTAQKPDRKPGTGQGLPGSEAALLGEVIRKAAGQAPDAYLKAKLFAPLGIKQVRWRRDKAGHLDTWSGLWMETGGMIRVGELVREDGRWNGAQVIPASWIQAMTTPGGDDAHGHGFGWKVQSRSQLTPAGYDRLASRHGAAVAFLKPYVGRTFHDYQDFYRQVAAERGQAAMAAVHLKLAEPGVLSFVPDRAHGYVAGDYIGNEILVRPATGVVAIRTVAWAGGPIVKSYPAYDFDQLGFRLDVLTR